MSPAPSIPPVSRLSALIALFKSLMAKYRITGHVAGLVAATFVVAFLTAWSVAGLAMTSTALIAGVVAGIMATIHLAFPSVSGKQVGEMIRAAGVPVPGEVVADLNAILPVPPVPSVPPVNVVVPLPASPPVP